MIDDLWNWRQELLLYQGTRHIWTQEFGNGAEDGFRQGARQSLDSLYFSNGLLAVQLESWD